MALSGSTIQPIIWVGDSRKQVRSFPEEVRLDIGVSLFDMQKGDTPTSAKPFKGVGSGVMEIVTRHDSNTFRRVYAVQIGKRIYVLHAFQKNRPEVLKLRSKILN